MAASQNSIGNSGENLAQLRLSKHEVFNVYFLGEKAPIADLMIEINDENTPYQALIQVKSTNANNRYNVGDGALKTPVPDDKLLKLRNRPLPTYVVGADLVSELIHIAPAYQNDGSYPSIPPRLKIDNQNVPNDIAALNQLKEDIINYYRLHNIPAYKQNYRTIIP